MQKMRIIPKNMQKTFKKNNNYYVWWRKKTMVEGCKFGCTSWLSGVSNLNPKIAIDFYNYYKLNNKKK